jgi:HK97 family phage prohead protease
MSRLQDLDREIQDIGATLKSMQKRLDDARSLDELLAVESETGEARGILQTRLLAAQRCRGLVAAGLPEPRPEGAPTDYETTLARLNAKIRKLEQLAEVQSTDMRNLYAAARTGVLRRAESSLQLKFVGDSELREIEGIATTPRRDRHGDVVESLGLRWVNPVPLLWAHAHDKPVGKAWLRDPTANGVRFKAKLSTSTEPGPLKDRLSEAWESVKAGLVQSVSIGFLGLASEPLAGGGRRWTSAEIIELSLCTIPSQPDARIDSVKAAHIAEGSTV